jgi:hypothetical protein
MKLGSLTRTLALVGAASGALLGCTAHAELVGQAEAPPPPPPPPQPAAEVEVEVAPPVVYAQPPVLVTVEPGISVVRDSDYPVYEVNGVYWCFRENVWYQSPTYERGWVRADVAVVPPTIVHRDHHLYVHYHPAHAETRPAPRREVPVRTAARVEEKKDDRREDKREEKREDKKDDKRLEAEHNRGTQLPHDEGRHEGSEPGHVEARHEGSEPGRVEEKHVDSEHAHGAAQAAEKHDDHHGSREEAATAHPVEHPVEHPADRRVMPELNEHRNAPPAGRPAPAPAPRAAAKHDDRH